MGEIGKAVTELAPAGKVFVHGEYWDAAALQPCRRERRCGWPPSRGWC